MSRSVAVNPAERFGDMFELLGALEGGAAQTSRSIRPRSIYERNPVRFWQLVSLLLALALIAVLATR